LLLFNCPFRFCRSLPQKLNEIFHLGNLFGWQSLDSFNQ
jgi:hypothetical protein